MNTLHFAVFLFVSFFLFYFLGLLDVFAISISVIPKWWMVYFTAEKQLLHINNHIYILYLIYVAYREINSIIIIALLWLTGFVYLVSIPFSSNRNYIQLKENSTDCNCSSLAVMMLFHKIMLDRNDDEISNKFRRWL